MSAPVRLVTSASRSGLVALSRLSAIVALAGCASSHSVTELPDGITVHTFRRDYSNVFVVARGEEFFMVDAGYEKDAEALANNLRSAGFDPAKLRAIVLTHGHHDHAGGAAMFQREFHVPVVAGAEDERLLAAGAALDPLCPTDAMARHRLEDDQAATFPSIKADTLIAADLPLGPLTGIPGRVASLPGHTAGSLVVTVPGAVFVGDLFRGAIVGSSAEVHFYMCDLEDNHRDVQTLLNQIAPEADLFFTGHFGPVGRDAVAERFLAP